MDRKENETMFCTRRSIRRFQQKDIPQKFLMDCVDSARLAPSAKNLQPLEYIIVTNTKLRNTLFSHVHWAGDLPDWNPNQDEQPMAYIVPIIQTDKSVFYQYDLGIALAHIVLQAELLDIGSCILKKIDTTEIQTLLNIPETYMLDSIVALGYKAEHPVVETSKQKTQYWLDNHDVLHVPKRPLESIVHDQTYE